MPVEIKELIIRAVVDGERRDAEGAAGGRSLDEDKRAIVDLCVREVLRIMKESKER